MNKKFLKHYMETNPEGTAQTYIFLVDNQDIALNIVMSGYQALCLVQEDDGYYFSVDSFIEEMRSIQFTGSCQSAYHYVAACTVKWMNDKLQTFFKDAGLDGKAGWQLFKEKEYLGKLDNQKEVEKLLEQYILRFEREPKEQPELSRFHLFDAKGNVKGVRDMEIVDYLVENVQFFVVGITPYYYEHGVFMEDHDGVRMKYRIQKLIYRDQVQSGVIKAGKVNCVIVKDLSRFGREYIEAGRWIEKTYPALNVRFISVTDQFDSKTADFSEKSFVVPIKNFVNESYCRDISGKVRSHQKIKREKGEFIGAFAPYGYCKDPENKNCLVIDSYAADIVRKIFSWKIDGFSLGAIAEKLNVRYVQSPKEYKKANGENYNSGFHSSDTPKWSAVQIKRILTNEVYIGNMVQGKQERISYKVKQRLDKPESEWVKVENTHPAIIRQSDFDVVQKLLQYDGRASKTLDSANFFSGFVFCGDCKTPMIRRVNQYKGKKKAFYICQTKNKGGDCTRHSIPEEVLKRIVLKEIQA